MGHHHPTLDDTLRGMQTTARETDTRGADAAVRTAAEETAVAGVLALLETDGEIPSGSRDAGIDRLVDEFWAAFPDFDPSEAAIDGIDWRAIKPGPEAMAARRQERLEAYDPTAWKDDFADGLGPGLFSVRCDAATLADIEAYLDRIFPDTPFTIEAHKIWGQLGDARATVRLEESCAVDDLSDHLSIDPSP